jgi:hypothetical protein
VALALVLMTLAKPVYVGAGLALFLLRWEEGPRARIFRWLFPAVVMGIALGLFVYWSQLKDRYEQAGSSAYSSGAQLRLLLAEPRRIPALAFDGVLRYAEELLLQSIFVRYRISPGMRFAAGLGSVVYAQLLLALAWGAARAPDDATRARRTLSLAILLGTWLALLSAVPLSLYLCCNELGAAYVRSVHGRYLIPAFPALLLALALVGRPVLGRWLTGARGRLALLAIVSVNLLCLFSLIGWHYYSPDLEWPL